MSVIKAEIDRRNKGVLWVPFPDNGRPHPQRMALESEADILFYGGAAGGGKSDLLVGCSLTRHRTSLIFRRQDPQLAGLQERAEHIIGEGRGRFNQKFNRWRMNDGRVLRFGSMDKEQDWKKYQGRPHDFMGFDEITHFTEHQFRGVSGWARLTNGTLESRQRVRVICAGNPPTDAVGMWVIDYWGPWLDERHPNPAKEGELRWYVTLDGKDIEVANNDPIEHFDERAGRIEMIKPMSRTFIRSLVTDNPILMANGYMATLQSMQEPLRSQMLYGDFRIGQNDAEDQVIPSAWIEAAQKRWFDPMSNEKPGPGQVSPRDEDTGLIEPVDSLGVDVARGGKDNTVITPRHGRWFGRQKTYPGAATPNGPEVLRYIVAAIPLNSDPQIKIDVIGVGSSPYDFAIANALDAYAMNGTERSHARSKAGRLKFSNMRAQWWWQLREALDPSVPADQALALPPGRLVLADLSAPRYKVLVNGIRIEEKSEIMERIGRSPDNGESIVYAHGEPRKPNALHRKSQGNYSPPIAIYQR